MHGREHHDGGLLREGEQIRGGDECAVACQIDDDGAARLVAKIHKCLPVEFNGADLHAEGGLAVVVQCENWRCKLLSRKCFLDEIEPLLIVFRKRRRDVVGGNGDRQRATMFVSGWQTSHPDEIDAVAAEFFHAFEGEFGQIGDVGENDKFHVGKMAGQAAAIRDALQCAFRQEGGRLVEKFKALPDLAHGAGMILPK